MTYNTQYNKVNEVTKMLDNKLYNNDPALIVKILEYINDDIVCCGISGDQFINLTKNDDEHSYCDSCYTELPSCVKCDIKINPENEYEEHYSCEYCDYILHAQCKGNYEDINFTPNGEVCMECVTNALDCWDGVSKW